MNLQRFLAEDRLRQHQTSPREIADHFKVVHRDLADADILQLSTDRRFATAYNAALQLATVVLSACGYRAAGSGHHWVTFCVLPDLMGPKARKFATYFDLCRSKRNLTEYDRAGEISEVETEELVREVKAFEDLVQEWLGSNFPNLVPPTP